MIREREAQWEAREAEIVSSAILLPAPEPGSGGVAQAQGLSDTKRRFYDAVAELKQVVSRLFCRACVYWKLWRFNASSLILMFVLL
jgi:hypothetical protein